ncbi:aspartyl/asparaginyl beta-hydroxylase domain-containing protein [Pseudoalteromonas sp. SCSIO 43201]|uniref:aspartyl/asparaginyl beta-hydroxylase domain-containing protein n=1 Tax=Pseudoalteromonas sp. SCSIO 43201 TaxID=2822842 RepID=UPI002074D4F0|nr:aspartyl/asparaginyl beta-hydroxylase domain-containing protein [Pseudoalteromonas sp. SCSIO 43201]USD30472.1 aspartyl/asparaginyl beta-hydroxylase domain-containing protein [Pseudoalteromonas sp. SCSIO 43201]
MTTKPAQTLNIDALLKPILNLEPQTKWPALLGSLLSQHQDNAELCYRVAVILEQIEAFKESEAAYFQCLELAPNNYLLYLYLGNLLEQRGEEHTALICYALCERLTGNFKQLQLPKNMTPQTVERFKNAWQCMERNLAVPKGYRAARWVQYSSTPFTTPQAPHLFYVTDLDARPIWPAETFSWYQEFMDCVPDIITEYKHAIQSLSSHLTPYLSGKIYENEFPKLANSDNWQALSLFKDGSENHAISSQFPKLKQALENVPCYGLTNTPYEVFYSKLAKGQTITPHYGLSNHSLTVHLAIDIPDACYLEVNGERVLWQDSSLTIFDDSYLHMAHNGGDKDRIVLIFSIWHPALTLAQRSAIQGEFSTRSEWNANLTKRLINYKNNH